MTALRNMVIEEVGKRVHIVRVVRENAKWWNQQRKSDDTPVFCGFYWVRGNEEVGPFGTRSAAIRDAYYRFVLQREAPAVGHALAYPADMPTINRRRKRA